MLKRQLRVGIMSAETISFSLRGGYTFRGELYDGDFSASYENGKVLFEGKQYDELLFVGGREFTLHNVTIGVNFHWQRHEDQTFVGDLRIITGHDNVLSEKAGLIAVNELDVEDYLTSVISSEMSATSSLELLKAHAVISRSWLLHPIVVENRKSKVESRKSHVYDRSEQGGDKKVESLISHRLSDRLIRWYERDAHALFDVCADDHCQRYQGITRQTSANVQRAIDATRGEVLVSTDNGEVCDARFYKCCGGVTELFENCWADEHYSYLVPVRDCGAKANGGFDLTQEQQARRFILTSPPAYCNTHNARILSQVLNNYDQETPDFYRWTVEYTQKELGDIVRDRSGIDFGDIEDLIPVRRGPSARIIELRIIGTKRTMTIGKELEIRKWLSRSHLYSSAFVVEKVRDEHGNTRFVLHGAGWGHGVGLCQIGAAVMAEEGFTYRQILEHYFPNTTLITPHL